MADLKGKVALVTGGTSGIGRGTVERLAHDGATLIFTGSNEEAAQSLSEATGARFLKSRVENPDDWARIEDVVRTDYGRLDIMFANAGVEGGDGSIESIDLAAWDKIVSVNLTGVMLTAKSAVRLMRANPGGPTGSIILNSSMSAHRAMGNFVAYSTTKTAVLALCKSIALHCATEGTQIRCNAILPGVVETDMIRGVIDRSPDPAAARGMFEGMAPMKRMAQVSEVAALVAFLASDDAAFISGSEYLIDGATLAGAQGV